MKPYLAKRSIYLLAGLICGLLVSFFASVYPASAESSEPSLTDDQIGAISQNCASIKQSLRSLQRTDARSRSYLGSAYERILSDFVTPIDLRLINVGQPNADLTNIHSNILSVRQDFVHQYTSYSQSLEELVNIDCQNAPAVFYKQLISTREKRAILAGTTTKLRRLFSEHLKLVEKIKPNFARKENANEAQ